MTRVLLLPTVFLLLLGISTYWISRGEAARDARSVVICNADDIATLDVSRMSWQNDIRTAMGLWEGLGAYDPKDLRVAEPVGPPAGPDAPRRFRLWGAADACEVSPDGKTYTFHLRADGRWSNGDPVTAKDFLFSWKRALDPATGADYANFFFYIKGAKAYYDAMKTREPADFSAIGVRAPDPRTITFELTAPCTYFFDLVAFPVYYPLHEASMQAHLDPNPVVGYRPEWTHPPYLVTNGPFRLAEWEFKRYLRLVPNEHYWDRQHVQASAVLIKAIADKRAALLALQQGDVDVLTFLPDDFGPELLADQRAGRRHDIHHEPVFGSYYYVYNCTRKPFDDKRVRKALALVIDRKKLVEDVTRLRQKPIGVLVPPGSIPGYAGPDGLEPNVEEARRLLAGAGFPDGTGIPEIEFLYNNEAGHAKVAQAVGQMWQQTLGLRVNYRGVERGAFRNDRKNGNFTIARAGWYGDYADPTTWLDLAKTGDNNNDGKFSDPAYDALLDKAAAEPDPAKRFALLRDAEAMLVRDQFPFIPLYQYADGYMFDAADVGGLYMNVRLLTQFKYLHRKEK
jgi:oligopeptide transport system substrate-binding protein